MSVGYRSDCASYSTPRSGRETLADHYEAIHRRLTGFAFLPWQREVAEVAFEVDETGRTIYRTVVVKVPRQSGKTTLLDAVLVGGALRRSTSDALLMAQDRNMSRRRLIDELADRRLVRSEIPYRVRRMTGSEEVRFENGSVISIAAATHLAGHGLTLDLATIDEVWSHDDYRTLLAVQPTMVTRPDAQLWIVSTEGTEESVVLDHFTTLGRESLDDPETRTAYFEWSMDPDGDPYDEDAWPRFMPALGWTTDVEAIRVAAKAMTRSDFLRSFCNVKTLAETSPFGDGVWDACRQVDAEPVGLLHAAADITPDRSRACVVVCGSGVVEVVADEAGTDWIADRLVELDGRWSLGSIAIDNAGPGVSLISELEYRGLRVTAVNATDMKAACGRFYDGVVSGRLAHRGQANLDAAAGSVRRRNLLDAWAWTRKGRGYVSPIVAATLAYWAWTEAPEAPLWLY